MAAALSLIAAKDGNGTLVSGSLQYLDLSGTGAGPWAQTNVIVDGIAGLQRAAVVAVNTAPVTATHPALVVSIRPDGNAVTASLAAAQTLATVTNLAQAGGVALTTKAASTAPAATDTALVVAISPNSVNANGQATMANSAPVVIASDQTAFLINLATTTSGGATLSSAIMAASTNATLVKNAAGQVYKIEVFNNSTNIGYLKMYNSASAPTAGSGTPVARYMVPGVSGGSGFISTFEMADAYGTGIGYTFTGGIADADTTAVAASAFIVNIHYK